jgi:L-alanine-DL-glutamate epimerase-like enolase superfamily enzyme
LEEVVVEITDDQGHQGYSEARGNGAYATGAATDGIVRTVVDLGRRLLGRPLGGAVDGILGGDDGALPLACLLIDGASNDAAARAAGLPLYAHLGAAEPRPMPTHAQIGFAPIEKVKQRAADAHAMGFSRIKLRVGDPTPNADLDRIVAVRDVVGRDVAIAVDANGGWDLDAATAVLTSSRIPDLAWIEQPLPQRDLLGSSKLRERVEFPVVADESVRSVADMRELASAGAADGVHIKLEKAGTIRRLQVMAAAAIELGLDVYVGQMDQGRLGSALTAHVAATIEAHAFELWGFQNVESDFASGIEPIGGAILPRGPGLGVDLDPSALALVKELS